MSNAIEITAASQATVSRRCPAAILVAASVIGIVADRFFSIRLDLWISLAIISIVAWICLHRFERRMERSQPSLAGAAIRLPRFYYAMSGTLLSGWICLFGAWHHWRWECHAPNDIVNFAGEESRIVRVTGKVTETPWIVHLSEGDFASWRNPDRTIFAIACTSIVSDSSVVSVAGRARVTIEGALPELSYGDLIECSGELFRPAEPANPGDFDQRAFLQSKGMSAVIRSNHIEAIRVISTTHSLWDRFCILRGMARKRAERLIERHLGTDTAPVAQAMLLGSRVQIDEETRRAFRESGMLHILAISGMNVGLLWTWLWSLCRWTGRSAKASIWIVLVSLPLYAMITDTNPPIVRATTVAVIVAFGQLIGRGSSIANSLSLAGLAVLAWNPTDLFNPGAQLSFLAVFAILHATSWLAEVRRQAMDVSDDSPLEDSTIRTVFTRFARASFDAMVVGLAVWIMTSPLVAREFHLVSPIGSILTVLLVIPVTIMFWIGYSFLLLGLVSSALFGWLGIVFDYCLRSFLWTVREGAGMQIGHVYVPAPPVWWIVGFYCLTLVPIIAIRKKNWGTAISVRAGLAWMVIGLAWGMCIPPHSGVTCTFISVGHGLGVLIECPNGRTALYDAGGMIGGGSTARMISQTLWSTGRARLDAIVISHADGDHCNAIPELSRIVSPGGLYIHRSFLDWRQPAVTSSIERSATAGSKVRLISEGQSIQLDPTVTLRVLHPPNEFQSIRDNPNSVVLCLEYSGRRILLTGDLEQDGLEQLLRTPPLDVDVLLSPHHGSLKANPTDLARWATPEVVVVSTPEPQTSDRLSSRYGPETQIITTAAYGAIRCHISSDGDLTIEPFKKRIRRPSLGAPVAKKL